MNVIYHVLYTERYLSCYATFLKWANTESVVIKDAPQIAAVKVGNLQGLELYRWSRNSEGWQTSCSNHGCHTRWLNRHFFSLFVRGLFHLEPTFRQPCVDVERASKAVVSVSVADVSTIILTLFV